MDLMILLIFQEYLKSTRGAARKNIGICTVLPSQDSFHQKCFFKTILFFPITLPGHKTLLHPISELSPIIAPIFLRSVCIFSSLFILISTNDLSAKVKLIKNQDFGSKVSAIIDGKEGSIGTVELVWMPQYTKFANMKK